MNLHKLILTNNACYKAGKTITPKGIMVHSTGANNPNLKRYVGPDDGLLGKNQYNNHWNQVISGLTDDEVIIEDTEFVKDVTENINSLTFEKMGKVDGTGYACMLVWMNETYNEIARITITEENGYQISHDGYYYKVGADLAIDMQPIWEMLNIAISSSPAPDPTN